MTYDKSQSRVHGTGAVVLEIRAARIENEPQTFRLFFYNLMITLRDE